jgi:hypothetical protein
MELSATNQGVEMTKLERKLDRWMFNNIPPIIATTLVADRLNLTDRGWTSLIVFLVGWLIFGMVQDKIVGRVRKALHKHYWIRSGTNQSASATR